MRFAPHVVLFTYLAKSARNLLERIEYGPELEEPFRRVAIDCPDHGRTFLNHNRTACCDSPAWVPSGHVKSRAVTSLNGAARSLARDYAFSNR